MNLHIMTTATSAVRSASSLRGDHYAGACDALRRLSADAGDSAAFTDYLKALVALGLGGAGRRLIERVLGSDAVEPDARQCLEQLGEVVRRCPSGCVPWETCAACFNGNLAAIEQRFPEVAHAVAAVGLSGFELYRDIRGAHHVLDLDSLRWCGGLADRQAAAVAAFSGRSPINPSAPIVFDGIGLGELFDEFVRRSRNTFLSYSAAVSIVEPDPAALAITLRVWDWTTTFSESRFSIFAGPNAERDFLAFLEADPNQPIPASVQRLPLTNRSPTRLHESISSLAGDRARNKELTIAEVNNRHENADFRYWASRFATAINGRARPLRVMGITSRFTTVLRYSMRELLDAASRAGCETHLVWEKFDHAIEYNVPAHVRSFEPDLIVMLSRLRHEFPDIPRNIPFLSWDQDALPIMRTTEAGISLDRLTFVAGYGAWFGLSHLGWPASQALADVPIAPSHAYVCALPDLPIDDRFRCDIAYISHCSETPREMRVRFAESWAGHPVVSRIYLGVTDQLLDCAAAGHNWTPCEIHSLVVRVAAESGVKLVDALVRELCMTCMSLSDRAFRHFALECVAHYAEQAGRSFHLYGNGWDRHSRLARFAAGRVAFGDEFVAACRGARLNLQLIEGGFLHSRSLDGLAAGGAFLTRSTRYDIERPRLLTIAQQRQSSIVEATISDGVHSRSADGAPSDAMDVGTEFWLKTIPLEPDAIALLPDLPQISFCDAESLASTADTLLRDDALREKIAQNMRTAAIARFSYDAHWKRLIAFISASLQSESVISTGNRP